MDEWRRMDGWEGGWLDCVFVRARMYVHTYLRMYVCMHANIYVRLRMSMYVWSGGKIYQKGNMEALYIFPLPLTSGSRFATDVIDCSKLKRITLLSLRAVYHLKIGK